MTCVGATVYWRDILAQQGYAQHASVQRTFHIVRSDPPRTRRGNVAMAIELKIPAVGESITEVYIGPWRKSVGDVVQEGEVLGRN